MSSLQQGSEVRERSYTNRVGLFLLMKEFLYLVELTLTPQVLSFVAQRNWHCRTGFLSRTRKAENRYYSDS